VSIRELSLIVDWIRGEYYLPEDEHPVLPHKEEVAKAAVTAARLDLDARPRIVGALPLAAETNTAKAERLFTRSCAACHSHVAGGEGIKSRSSSAPPARPLAEWLADCSIRKGSGDQYFGRRAIARRNGILVREI
jgi:mono/diheme cytochrome c family protein